MGVKGNSLAIPWLLSEYVARTHKTITFSKRFGSYPLKKSKKQEQWNSVDSESPWLDARGSRFAQNSILSDIHIATPAFFLLMFAWNIFFLVFNILFLCSCMCASEKAHSCFFF